MRLTDREQAMLAGVHGFAARKSMEILAALGEIYGARRLIDVASVQISGVSYDNLGEAGLSFLSEMAQDGRVRVLTTLNPAGMDVENWEALGIDARFAARQQQVLEKFSAMGVVTTCTCTPYFVGNLPRFGQHVAWAESSAVCFANSVLGARTNREGGPSALAAAITGKTPAHGFHLEENRRPRVAVHVKTRLRDETDFALLGCVAGGLIGGEVCLFRGVDDADVETLKALCASIATYGGTALFHMEGITPEAGNLVPQRFVEVSRQDLEKARAEFNDEGPVDFVSIGCPHVSLRELQRIAAYLADRAVVVETWIHVARPLKETADRMGYTKVIENAGARIACDTCMVVAPLKGRFRGLATNSGKAVYYGRAKNGFRTVFRPLEACLDIATGAGGGK